MAGESEGFVIFQKGVEVLMVGRQGRHLYETVEEKFPSAWHWTLPLRA
jgi:hypothetical protein